MKTVIAILLALLASAAVTARAQNIKPKPPAQVVIKQQGSATRATAPRLSTISITESVDGSLTVGSTRFANHNPLTVTYQGQIPKCPSKPPVATRSVQCPVGYTGSWTQTQDWQSAAYPTCWVALPWAPTTAPDGACMPVTPPPPGGDIDLSYVNKAGAAYATYKAWVDSCLSNNNCYQFLPTDAAFMAKLDGGTQYCAKAISDADRYASRVEAAIAAGGQPNFTGDPQGMDGLSGDSYLAVGPRVRDLAIVQKWCPATASQKQRWTAIIAQAVFNVWNPNAAQWGGRSFPWSGWTVTPPDPGDNYYYSFTQATQMYEWVTGDLTYHARTWPVLSAYFNTLPTGGSEEGTGYGTSHKGLFEDIRWQRDIFSENYVDAHLTNSIYYWVHATTPDYQHFAAIGDQSRINPPAFTDYQRALIAQAMATTTDATAKAQGSYLLHHVTPATMQSTYDYRDGLLPTGSGGTAPTALSYFGQSTGDLFMRTDWTANALWVALRAGRYNQSHAHQDQGAFQIYYLGNWLAVDQSVWGSSGIDQEVTNNSTLRFEHNGAAVRQVYNSVSTMTVTGTDPASGIHATANLQPAVGAAASAWTRTLDFVGRVVTVTDSYTASSGYTATFQLQVPPSVAVSISGNVISAGHLKATVLVPANPTITNANGHIDVKGGTSGYQVRLETQ